MKVRIAHEFRDWFIMICAAFGWYFSDLWMKQIDINQEYYADRILWIAGTAILMTTVFSWQYIKAIDRNKEKIDLSDYIAHLFVSFCTSGLIYVVMIFIRPTMK